MYYLILTSFWLIMFVCLYYLFPWAVRSLSRIYIQKETLGFALMYLVVNSIPLRNEYVLTICERLLSHLSKNK